MSSISPLAFTGISSFSDDLQTILQRSVSIASVPLSGMQNEQSDLLSKKQLLTDLRGSVSSLAGAISALGALGDSKAVTASVSNSNRVSVSVSGTLGTGAHTISDITSVARAPSTTSASGYETSDSTSVSTDGLLELVVGDETYAIDLTAAGENNLNGLADAINSLRAGVTASVLNTGTGQTPYYLSLTSDSTGQKAFELRETASRSDTNLLVNSRPAADAAYSTNAGFATAGETSISPDGTLQLAVGSSNYALDISAANTLNGLRDAINSSGAAVTAEIVDSSTTGADRYRLKVTSAGGEAVQLQETADDPATNLLTNAHQGANAVFRFDGLAVVKADNVINDVLPGLTFTILSKTGADEEVTVTLSSSRASLAGALEELVSSYNTVAGKTNAQIGSSAGLLTGDFIIRETQESMRALTTYSSSGQVKSLADLGILLDDKGVMSFDSSTFYSLSGSELAAAFEFLGSATTGLGAVASRFNSISDPLNGLIKLQQNQYDAADSRLNNQIDDLTARIILMQTSLSQQLQKADALLATLESQQTILDASIQGLNLALYGRNDD